VKAGLVFVCSPFGGREGDKKNTTGDVGYPSIYSGGFFATLPYRSARVVFVYGKDSFFFRKYVCIQVFLWSIHAGIAQPGEWGLAPILDKLESFVVNAFWLVAGRFFK
jgi:hypothetical protein